MRAGRIQIDVTHGTSSGNGLVVVVQRGCHTCDRLLPELAPWLADDPDVVLMTQDPGYPPELDAMHDVDLARSRELGVEGTPALVRTVGGRPVERIDGWDREAWQRLSGRPELGRMLPDHLPGCAAKNVDPEAPAVPVALRSRRVRLGEREDVHEAVHSRGWTDGLPVVPPSEARVAAMLGGTVRDPDEVVAVMPPAFAEVTVEKVAINAVMAGCRPEYLPVVLAAVSAAATDTFNIHGVAATTHFVGPVVVVNGPVAAALGMNARGNALGPGNRANLTIGRALNLVIRNVGGARPGEIDRSTLGSPGKLSFCFAEDEQRSPWSSLAAERGVPASQSSVTLFAGVGPQPVVDQRSTTAESLVGSLALSLRTVAHVKLAGRADAMVVVAPEHAAIFGRAGWDKSRLRHELLARLTLPASEMVRGAGGVAEGIAPPVDRPVNKFAPDGLWFVHAGGSAGLYSAIISGWVNGPAGSQMTTVEVDQ
jgi:hypothetical protein